jgi:hypothetical protein
MNQATRLMTLDFDRITDTELSTITADDVIIPPSPKKIEKSKIGFC